MAAPERAVCDQDVRDLVTGDLGATFLLEAGAGTGKTRVLVDRYVRCVLDEAMAKETDVELKFQSSDSVPEAEK